MDDITKLKSIFVTGKVGIGKTTLIRESTLPFLEYIGGFYTEEIKKDGKRYGFMLKTFSGQEVLFASIDIKQGPKVSKYRVDTGIFDEVGVKEVVNALKNKKIIVIDEIGSMEMFSKKFQEVFADCLMSSNNILATIREKSQPFSNEIKKFNASKVLTLTKDNFINTKEEIRKWLNNLVKRKISEGKD
ncbi:MAG: nucleoside-triphosphatase [bacterium]